MWSVWEPMFWKNAASPSQGQKLVEQETNVQQLPVACLFRVWLIFSPEDADATFLPNVSSHTEYMALYPRRWQHSR
jgi:hypothetical protein